MLTTLVLLFSLSSAKAEEPTVTPVPATNTVAPRANRPGLRNQAASVITYDALGCPRTHDLSSQYRQADEVAVIMDAASDAGTRCVVARAEAEAIKDRAEAERLRAEGDRGASLLLASAGADVARAADGPVYINVDSGVVATGNAAPLAAVDGSLGAVGLSPWVLQGASDLSALAAINGGVINPPKTDPVTTSAPKPAVTPKPKATVEDAEARARAAAAAAGL